MPISTLHPELKTRSEDIRRNRLAVEGERAVKAAGVTYLPVPPGMTDGPQGGVEILEHGKRVSSETRYGFYKRLAEFPEELGEALQGFQGIIHSKPPTIKLPPKLDYLRETATPDGRTIEKLWTLMTEEILTGGRIALLCDVVDDKILFAPYSVENVLNWNLRSRREGEAPDWVILREMAREEKRDDEFETEEVVRYLELRLLANAEAESPENPLGIVYHRAIWEARDGKDPEIVSPMQPISFFGQFFPAIPLIVVNSLDLGFNYGPIPLSPLVKIAMSLYRRSADYNRSLYIKTDPQPVISGVDPDSDEVPDRIGGEEVWTFSNPQAKASYLDIDGDGIPHQRTAIQDDWTRFHLQSAKLLQASETPSESGEAVRRKQAAKQVTLKAVAANAAEGLEMAMKKAGAYFGAAPTSVVFKPDLDFSVPKMSGDEASKWAQAKATGFPISDKSLHEMARLGGATELSWEDEQEAMEEDAERVPPPAPPLDDAEQED